MEQHSLYIGLDIVKKHRRNRKVRHGILILLISLILLPGTLLSKYFLINTSFEAEANSPSVPASASEVVTLNFVGDINFEGNNKKFLRKNGNLGDISEIIASADFTMGNLETAITSRGSPDLKSLEVSGNRYNFRAPAMALNVIANSGVNIVTMANNHGADYGEVGLRDTLAAKDKSPIPIVGIGENKTAAFTPFMATLKGTTFGFLGADASYLESNSKSWNAGKNRPGLAGARDKRKQDLISAVKKTSTYVDTVVVYLHWGREKYSKPTPDQIATVRALSRAGADIIVGSHAHVIQASGWFGDTYVAYGLGNFFWYHGQVPDTGILQVKVKNGKVFSDKWTPASIPKNGGSPIEKLGDDKNTALKHWEALRRLTNLSDSPPTPTQDTAVSGSFKSSINVITPAGKKRLASSYRKGCPLAISKLRYLKMNYIGFDGKTHEGEMIVAEKYALKVTSVFKKLYDSKFPIQRMQLVSDFGGDDVRSMNANNTSGFNCRPATDTTRWSKHAYGEAIDINPIQNPYVRSSGVDPTAGKKYATVDRSVNAIVSPGVVKANDVVVGAFLTIGWEWGGSFKDYQHFSVNGN